LLHREEEEVLMLAKQPEVLEATAQAVSPDAVVAVAGAGEDMAREDVPWGDPITLRWKFSTF
jgi:hypothetical protein